MSADNVDKISSKKYLKVVAYWDGTALGINAWLMDRREILKTIHNYSFPCSSISEDFNSDLIWGTNHLMVTHLYKLCSVETCIRSHFLLYSLDSSAQDLFGLLNCWINSDLLEQVYLGGFIAGSDNFKNLQYTIWMIMAVYIQMRSFYFSRSLPSKLMFVCYWNMLYRLFRSTWVKIHLAVTY